MIDTTTRHISVKGVSLEYVRFGQGAPLLVISPSWWPLGTWHVGVAQHLASHFEVVIFNHRGVAGSDETADGYVVDQFAEDAVGLADALGYQRMHVLGFAIGGATAMVLARDAPDLPLTLTVVGTGAPSPASARDLVVRRAQEEIAAEGYERYIRSHADNGVTAFSPGFYRGNPTVPAALAEALWVGHAREDVFLKHVAARASYDFGGWVEKLRVPTLIAVGAEDTVARGPSTPLVLAHELAKRVGGATLRVFPMARHMMPWECPEEFAAALRSFALSHQ